MYQTGLEQVSPTSSSSSSSLSSSPRPPRPPPLTRIYKSDRFHHYGNSLDSYAQFDAVTTQHASLTRRELAAMTMSSQKLAKFIDVPMKINIMFDKGSSCRRLFIILGDLVRLFRKSEQQVGHYTQLMLKRNVPLIYAQIDGHGQNRTCMSMNEAFRAFKDIVRNTKNEKTTFVNCVCDTLDHIVTELANRQDLVQPPSESLSQQQQETKNHQVFKPKYKSKRLLNGIKRRKRAKCEIVTDDDRKSFHTKCAIDPSPFEMTTRSKKKHDTSSHKSFPLITQYAIPPLDPMLIEQAVANIPPIVF